ncbi:MAG: hypothetical protein NZ761_03425, partial [Dehalococcoidia bacterium]|nr:hypothetical protein [Dehalococcoidia bacterium]
IDENARPDLGAVARQIGDQITTIVQALGEAANIDEAIVERLQKLRDAVQVVQDVAQAAKDLAALDPDFSVASEVVEYLPYLAAQVATQVDEALRELELADIGDKTQRVRDALQTVRDTFGFVRDLLGIDPDEFMVAPELIEYLPYVAAMVTEQLDQAAAQLSVENIAPRAQAIRDALGIVRDAVSAVRDLAEFTGGADIQAKVQELAGALVGIVSGLATAVTQLGEEQLAALAETAQARLGPVIEFLDRAVEVVGKAQNQLPNRIGAALENLAQALQTLVGPVFRQVGEQFGTSVGEGFLAGLAALEPAVLARAQALARAVQQVIASALKISSPSRVMMRLGQETALGFALGIHEVLRGIDRFVPLDDGEFLSALRPGTAASRSEGEQPVFRPEIRVYIGDRELRGIVRTELVEVLR